MRKRLIALFLPAIIILGFQERGLQVHPRIQQNLKGKPYALVVGINNYKYVTPLNYAVNDAKEISQLLKDKYGFEVLLLTSSYDTTKKRILQSMDKLAARLSEEDRLLFYFSGHGKDLEGFSGRKTGYLIPIDGKPDEMGATCISMQTIREYAATIFKVKHVLFLIDSCFSGIVGQAGKYANMEKLPKASLEELIQLTAHPGGQIITAGRSSEIAREDDMLGHGYFSHYVLEALKGPGDIDYNGLITVDEIYHYVRRKVLARSNSKQTPQLRFLDRGGEGEFVFVLGEIVKPPSPPPPSVLLPGDMTFLGKNDLGYIEALNKKDNSEMVLILEKGFTMGSSKGEGEDNEEPKHEVYLKSFFIDKYEVTNTQYDKFIRATGYQSHGNWKKYYTSGKENHPVVNVSWNDAASYAHWAGKRLPTEAEWEMAARGGLEGKRYPWGDYIDTSKANYLDSQYGTTQPVGSYPPNGFGLCDMGGNVWEWTADWFNSRYYSYGAQRNPSGPYTGTYRVFRGGSWGSIARFLRVAYRNRSKPEYWYFYLGFRCAKDCDLKTDDK